MIFTPFVPHFLVLSVPLHHHLTFIVASFHNLTFTESTRSGQSPKLTLMSKAHLFPNIYAASALFPSKSVFLG